MNDRLPALSARASDLYALLPERVLLFDGAMGTSIQTRNLSPEDFGGLAYEGCNEHLVLTCPEAITQIHDGFLQAGSDIIETNTFGATSIVLAEYGLHEQTGAINRAAARLARACAQRL